MSTLIKTNKIKYSLDKNMLSKEYDVFQIRTTKSYFKSGAYIIDAPLINNGVCSVLFNSGKEFYVLMKHNDNNISDLRAVLKDADDFDCITLSKLQSNTLDDEIVIQLLINSLGNYSSSFLKFNNLTGHLYCFHPNWLVKSKKSDTATILKVPCLEVKLSKDFRLNLEVHTFSSELLKNKIEFKRKRFKDYSKYVFSAHNTLRRKIDGDTDKVFIMRQTKNARTEIPFLDMQSIEKFNQSKMGILSSVIESFNDNFKNIANIEFEDIAQYEVVDYTRTVAKENSKIVSDLLSSKSVKIIDCIDDDYSKVFCENIKRLLFDKYAITANIGKRISKDYLNIRLIHNAAHYIDCEDEYKTFDNATVQHVTFEDFSESSEFAISTVIHELLIKDDLKNGKITLFDWSNLNFDKDISFGIESGNDDIPKYYFMTIHPDGCFNISEQTLNLFEETAYNQCVDIFENAKINFENIRGLIKDEDSNINIIKDTGWITIPEIANLKAELSSGNTKLRGKEKRGELLQSCLDIKLFNSNGHQYYFVGTIGNGMRWTVNRAAIIRRIEPYKDSELMFEKLLPLMNVTFVRNGQLTIVPFPFKYLREYIKSLEENHSPT